MTHSQTHAGIAFASIVALAGIALLAPPVPPASAEVQASRICREQGVKPNTAGYDYCLLQAERALEWGEPELARAYARVTSESREACQSYGLEPTSSGYSACMERETKARTLLIFSEEKLRFGPQIADQK
jgi:hypothetical protein